MKTILIPTDFSENSWNAIEYAVTLFDGVSCNFCILHVGNLSKSSVLGNSFSFPKEKLHPSIKEKIKMLFERIECLSSNKKHRFTALQEYGDFIQIVRKTVDGKNVDLIVMGTTGASGLKASIVGSNTGDVITKVACNVLVVPEKAEVEIPTEIVFPTDFNSFYTHSILEGISAAMQLTKASLRVLNVSGVDEHLTEIQERNQGYLFDYLHETYPERNTFHTLTHTSIVEAIQLFVEAGKIDLILMAAKHLNFLQQILFDTTIEKISFQTKIPLLVLHE